MSSMVETWDSREKGFILFFRRTWTYTNDFVRCTVDHLVKLKDEPWRNIRWTWGLILGWRLYLGSCSGVHCFSLWKRNAVTPRPQIRSIVSCNCCRGFTDRRGSIFFTEKKASDGSFLNKSPTKQPWRRTTWVFSSVRRPYAEVSFRDNPNQLSIITVNYRSYFQSTSDFTKNASASARRTAQVPVHPPRAVGKKSHFFLCLLPENWLSSF